MQTIVTYEETGNVTQAYDSGGNMTLRTDEEGIAVAYEYDELNRLIYRYRSPLGSNDLETYGYDGLNRLVDADKDDASTIHSTFGYDALSRVTYENQTVKGTAKQIDYTYDKGGNRISLKHDAWSKTLAYAYDSRDRCYQIDHVSGTTAVRIADYTWLGNNLSRRDTTCDYPGSTKPKFKSDFARDGIMRVTKLTNEHLTYDQAGATYGDLGTWDYSYDTASNEISAMQAGNMAHLAADATHTYDSAHRVITTYNRDTQDWNTASWQTSWYNYDDLGNRISHQYRDATPIGYAHDKANRMTTLAGLTQGYDKAGNLTLGYSADRGTSYKYKYDYLNRLTGVYDSTGATRKVGFVYDAMGRRVEYDIDLPATNTRKYWYDGQNEINVAKYPNAGYDASLVFVHGISYIDERLAMVSPSTARSYYYVLDRMYNVRALVDDAGALIERYVFDDYGRIRNRESAGRGDMNDDTSVDSTYDEAGFLAAKAGSIWDPRADMNGDGRVTQSGDQGLFYTKLGEWPGITPPTVSQAFSDVDNPYGFQGRVHFAIDTNGGATDGKLMLVDHRARMNDPVTGRWLTRDPLPYWTDSNLFEYIGSNPFANLDPNGKIVIGIDGAHIPPFSSGREEIDSLGREILSRINAYRNGHNWGDDPVGYVPLNGNFGEDLEVLDEEFNDYAGRVSMQPLPGPCGQTGSRLEGFVVIGYSDGATTIFQEFARGNAGRALGDAEISYVGLIDMVRHDFSLQVNTDPNVELIQPTMRNSDLIRDLTVRASQAGWWKGYVRINPWNPHWTHLKYDSDDHFRIVNNPFLREDLVYEASLAYEQHLDDLRAK